MSNGRQIDELYWVLNARTAPLVGGVADAQQRLTKFAAFLKTPQGALAAVGVAAAVVGAKATAMAAELDAAMREIASILPGTVEDLSDIRDQIVALSTQVPQPPVQLTRAFYDIVSAGIEDTTEAMQILEVAARAAVAGGLKDSAEAVNAITTILNAYQLNASDAQRVSDVLFETVNLGVIRFGELADVVGEVANTAALANVGIEEIGAGISVLTQRGIGGAEAVTSLNRLLLALADSQSKGAEEARKLGVEFGINELRTKGLTGLMQELSGAVGDDVELLQLVLPEIRAFRGASVLAGKGLDDFIATNGRFQTSAGATQSAFEDMVGSWENQTQLLKNKVGSWFEKFGEKILPHVLAGLKALNRQLGVIEDPFSIISTLGADEVDDFIRRAVDKRKELTAKLQELKDGLEGLTRGERRIVEAEIERTQRQLDDLGESFTRLLERRQALEEPVGSDRPDPAPAGFTEEQLEEQAKLFEDLRDRMVASTRTATDDMQLEIDRFVQGIKDAFGEIPEEFQEILDRMQAELAAAAPLEDFQDRLEDIREGLAEFGSKGSVPGVAAMAGRLVELRGEIQAVHDTLDPSTNEWKEYQDVLREIDGVLRRLARPVAETGFSLGKSGDKAKKTADDVLLLTRAFIDLGSALGVFDRNAAGALSSLANVVGAVQTGLEDGFSGGIVAAIGSGLAGFLGSILGGDNAAEERARRLEEERNDLLKRNNEAIDRWTTTMADQLLDKPLGQAASAAAAIEAALKRWQEILDEGQSGRDDFNGPGSGGDIPTFMELLVEELGALGLSLQQIRDIAESLGYELDETVGGFGDFAEALSRLDIASVFETFTGQLSLLRREFELFDIDDPREQVSRLLAILGQFTDMELPDLEADGAEAVDAFIRQFFSGLKDMTPEEMAARFGGLTINQILDLLGQIEGALDQVDPESDGSQTDGGYRISQGITQVTGDLMISILVTQTVHLARIDRGIQELVRGIEFVGVQPPTKREIGDVLKREPRYASVVASFGDISLQVVSPDPERAAEVTARDLVDHMNQKLGDALSDKTRAFGGARSE